MSPESIIKVIATANVVAELFIFFSLGKTQDRQFKDIGIQDSIRYYSLYMHIQSSQTRLIVNLSWIFSIKLSFS